MDARERRTDLRVGIFVILGIVVLSGAVALIGQERRLFETPVYLRALLPNVAGLKLGAPVRLAGVDVGIVSGIEFPKIVEGLDEPFVKALDTSTLSTGQKLNVPMRKFAAPITVTVDARDPAGELRLELIVVGKDAFGTVARERISVRTEKDQDRALVLGRSALVEVSEIKVARIQGNATGTHLEIRIGPARQVTIVMRISNKVIDRIRLDSEAKVDSMGLLGDKTIDITLGSHEFAPHKEGDFIKSQAPFNLDAVMKKAENTLSNLEQGSDQLVSALDKFGKAGGEDPSCDCSRRPALSSRRSTAVKGCCTRSSTTRRRADLQRRSR